MKNLIVFICVALSISTNAFAQLPPTAQRLYDSAYAQDPTLVNYTLTNRAQILATPDGNSFYVQWFPTNAIPNKTPVVVSLHGSDGNAFMEFKSWYPRAQSHGCGIIALQWYRYNSHPPNDYFPDDTLYSYLDSALRKINYPSNKALLHGFSRGAARSYSIIFRDMRSGNNYFCTTISNSGDADLSYPLYDSINRGVFGAKVFAGKRWNLFCGGGDVIVGCTKMSNTQTWLQSQGATVEIFIQDPTLGHNGFQLPTSSAYKDSMLNNYLLCYNGTLDVREAETQETISFFPNPFSVQATFWVERPFQTAALTMYNCLGQTVKRMDNLSGQTFTLVRDNLPSGLYFVQLTEGKKIYRNKLVIIDK